MLSLSQVEHGNESRRFVALGVVRFDGFDSLEILRRELEGYIRVILRRIPVHEEFVGGERNGRRERT